MRINEGNIEVIDNRMAEIFREKTPQQRLSIAFGMWSSARKYLVNYLKTEHPDWSDTVIQKETARRLSHGAV